MSELKTKAKNIFLTCIIVINIIYIIGGSVLFSTKEMSYKEFSIGFVFFIIINFFVTIFFTIKKQLKKNIAYFVMLSCIFFGVISTIFAKQKEVALWGFSNRYEGLVSIVYYFSVMILTSFLDKDYKKIIANCILLSGVVHCFYAIIQEIEWFKVDKLSRLWITGFITNPNFFGSYMIICFSYAIGLFIDENGKKKKVLYFIYSLLFIVGTLISNSMSCIVGMICVLIVFFIHSFIHKKFIKTIPILIALGFVIAFAILTGMGTVVKDLVNFGYETNQITQGNVDEHYGTHRIYIWKETLKVVPNYLVHGVGIDGFFYAFGDKPLSIHFARKLVFDKAHNEYLQVLITQGIFALISYICMYGLIVIGGIKNSLKNKEIYLLLPVLGYLVQAFFNISVIEVAPIFYIAMGLCLGGQNDEKS